MTPQQVQGVDVVEVVQIGKGSQSQWVIEKVFGEFNSGAWLVDTGCNVSCPARGGN